MSDPSDSSSHWLKPDRGILSVMPLASVEMNVAKLAVAVIGASMLFGQLGVGISTVLNQFSEDNVSSRQDTPAP